MKIRRTWRVDFSEQSEAEQSAPSATRRQPKPVQRRLVKVDGQLYVAFSAHDLLESLSEQAPRPGLIE